MPSTLYAVRLSSQQQKFLLITRKGRSCEIIKIFGSMWGQYDLDTTLWSVFISGYVISIRINSLIVFDAPIRLAQGNTRSTLDSNYALNFTVVLRGSVRKNVISPLTVVGFASKANCPTYSLRVYILISQPLRFFSNKRIDLA